MIGTEMYKNRVEAPPKRNAKGVYQHYLIEFMKTDNMTMKLNCSNLKEAEYVYKAMLYGNKAHNYNVTVWKRNCAVYVIKG